MQNEKWFIIVNPVAGNGAAIRQWTRLQQLLQQHLPNSVIRFSQQSGHAIELAMEAIQNGYRHLLGVGGDGTNHEIVNGIFTQRAVAADQIVYALLPVGTGNDWVRTHGIPRRPKEWLQMLGAGKTILHDVGVVQYFKDNTLQQRYFLNVAGMAYDAFVVAYAERYKKWIVHKILYLLMVVVCLFRYRLLRARVFFDGQMDEDYYYTINVGIARYSGGGMQLVPHADPQDGLLALTLARRVSKLGVLLSTWRFYNGTLHRHSKIDIFQVKQIRVEAPMPVGLEADGELLGETPVTFGILPKALRVVAP